MKRTFYVHGTYINYLRDVYDFSDVADEEIEARVSADGTKVSMRASPETPKSMLITAPFACPFQGLTWFPQCLHIPTPFLFSFLFLYFKSVLNR